SSGYTKGWTRNPGQETASGHACLRLVGPVAFRHPTPDTRQTALRCHNTFLPITCASQQVSGKGPDRPDSYPTLPATTSTAGAGWVRYPMCEGEAICGVPNVRG